MGVTAEAARWPKLRRGWTSAVLLLILLTSEGRAMPRPESRGHRQAGLHLGRSWGLDSLANLDRGNSRKQANGGPGVEDAVQQILSKNNTPLVRLFVNDHLFLHHLKLYLKSPSGRHLHQLENRARTLRRRRTDEVSSRFFLRD